MSSSTHRRYVARETAVSVLINVVLSVAFAALIARGKAAVPLWGAGGMAIDFIPQTFMILLATTLAITFISRTRLRKGTVQPMPRAESGLFAKMPRNAFLRGLLVALGATIVLSPLAAGLLYLLGVASLPAQSFVIMKALYGAALTLLVAPRIIRAALASGTTGVQANES